MTNVYIINESLLYLCKSGSHEHCPINSFSVTKCLWRRDRGAWLELDQDYEVGDRRGRHSLHSASADREEPQGGEVLYSWHLVVALSRNWPQKEPSWQRDKDFLRGGLQAAPPHVDETFYKMVMWQRMMGGRSWSTCLGASPPRRRCWTGGKLPRLQARASSGWQFPSRVGFHSPATSKK